MIGFFLGRMLMIDYDDTFYCYRGIMNYISSISSNYSQGRIAYKCDDSTREIRISTSEEKKWFLECEK
ncbi:MAG: hypothetical protein KC550_08070, partial [Nanoarchaeota archaeon]|nr:hypothetical protein [Nanoarchaeota archaeon]